MTTEYEKLGVFYLGREYDAAHAQLTATPVLYDSRDLTTHAVCLGMTGSGKTGLCVALLEEATTAVRSAARIGREYQDVAQADESAAAVTQKIQDLKDQCDRELAALATGLDPASITLRPVQLNPRKSDTAIGEVALAWVPWRNGSDGFPAPAC